MTMAIDLSSSGAFCGVKRVSNTLRESLSDWTDWDSASYALAACINILGVETSFHIAKQVFWSNHPVARLLINTLDAMVAGGILERREEPDIQYRWNAAFLPI